MQTPHTLLDDIQDYLKYLKDMGVTGFECTPETLARIDAWNKPPVLSPGRPLPRNREKTSENLEDILSDLASCSRCGLSKTRNKLVFGEGDPKARLVFVGEAPGFDEDASGKPFVGKAGQLLTKIIQAIHLTRDQVYICNIIKCRPPGNRNPEPDEIKACLPFLQRQLRVIQPDYICALGSIAAQTLLDTKTPISRLRGNYHMFGKMKVLPTYHPSYLLRNPEKKRDVWEDMQRLIRDMDLKK
jgi:DNA polymerase